MNLIKLKSLEMEGFRSFKNKTRVVFPESGICLIKGASASGKSSFSTAISFALDFCPKPATVLKSNSDPETWYAQVELDINDECLISSRGNSAKLYYHGDVPGTIAQKKDKLSQILGINTNLIKYLTYRTQRSNGMFLSLSDETKKEFLSEILSVNSFDKASENTAENIKDLEKSIAAATSSIATKEAQIKALESMVGLDTTEDLTARIDGLQATLGGVNEKILQLSGSKSTLNDNLTQINLKHRVEQANANNDMQLALLEIYKSKEGVLQNISESSKVLETQKSELQNTYQTTKQEIDTIKDTIRQFERSSSKIDLELSTLYNALRNNSLEVKSTRSTIAVLEYSDKCGVCAQPLSPGHILANKDKIKELEVEIIAIEARDVKINYRVSQENTNKSVNQSKIDNCKYSISELNMILGELEAKIKEKSHEIEVNKATLLEGFDCQTRSVHEAAKTATKDRTAKHSVAQIDVESQINEINKLLEQQKSQKQELLLQTNSLESQRDVCVKTLAKIAKINENIVSLNEELTILEYKLKLERDIYSVVHKDGFPAHYFEQILEEISIEVNRLLALVPNTGNISFSFGDKTSKSGVTRKTISSIVELNGVTIPFSELSGGQSSVVEFLVDLAIREIISRRTGVRFNFFILDEIIGRSGKIEKDALIELLQSTTGTDTLYLLVDHDPERQDQFPYTISITNTNGESKID